MKKFWIEQEKKFMNDKQLIFKNVLNEPYVINGKIIFDSRSCAVTGTIMLWVDGEHSPRVLVSQRGLKAADFKGLYNCVAGYLDKNEFGYEAMFRETFEETGLNLIELALSENVIGVLSEHIEQPWYVNTDPKENRQNVSLRYGICFKYKAGVELPKLTTIYNEVEHESENPMWLSYDEIDKYNFAFEHEKTIKQYYNNYLSSFK
jgi:8-oxo-dGTP pyrophosphatase MutT (NUDIX family)